MKTREEKINRLMELRPTFTYEIAGGWVVQAEELQDKFLDHYKRYETSNRDYYGFAEDAWNVHTGLAFTKLFRALK